MSQNILGVVYETNSARTIPIRNEFFDKAVRRERMGEGGVGGGGVTSPPQGTEEHKKDCEVDITDACCCVIDLGGRGINEKA